MGIIERSWSAKKQKTENMEVRRNGRGVGTLGARGKLMERGGDGPWRGGGSSERGKLRTSPAKETREKLARAA